MSRKMTRCIDHVHGAVGEQVENCREGPERLPLAIAGIGQFTGSIFRKRIRLEVLVASNTAEAILQNVHRTSSNQELRVWEVFRVAVMIVVNVAKHDEVDIVWVESACSQLSGHAWFQLERTSIVEMLLQDFRVPLLSSSQSQIKHHSEWLASIGSVGLRSRVLNEKCQRWDSPLGSFVSWMYEEVVRQCDEATCNWGYCDVYLSRARWW